MSQLQTSVFLLVVSELCKSGQELESVFSTVKVTGGFSVRIDWSGKKNALESLTHKHVFKSKVEAEKAIKFMASRKTQTGKNIGTPYIVVEHWIKNFHKVEQSQAPVLDYKF